MESINSYSDSYLRIEQIIRKAELSLSELEHLLDDLVRQNQLTSAEQQALLALAWETSINDKPSA